MGKDDVIERMLQAYYGDEWQALLKPHMEAAAKVMLEDMREWDAKRYEGRDAWGRPYLDGLTDYAKERGLE